MTGRQRPAIAPRLAARPVDPRRGLPIPYVNVEDDGTVNFAMVNGRRVLECVRHKLCGLCGQPQDSLVAFVGGIGGFQHRLYTDPPGHLDCMRSAIDLCPYLKVRGFENSERCSGANSRCHRACKHRRGVGSPNSCTVDHGAQVGSVSPGGCVGLRVPGYDERRRLK